MNFKTYLKKIELQLTRKLVRSSSFLYNIARWARCLTDEFLINRAARANKPFVIIYQQGRVASTSVYESLYDSGISFPTYHIHSISAENTQKQIDSAKLSGSKVFRHLYVGNMLSIALANHKAQKHASPWKVISIFRDPLAIMISLHFLNAKEDSNIFSSNVSALKHFESLFSTNDPSNWAICTWFDDVFYDELGIDVYQHPFNTDTGYTIIKEEKLDILLLRFEDLSQAFKNGCPELFGSEEGVFELKHANVHKNSQHDARLSYIKQHLKIPREFCDRVYSTKLVKHFYSPKQIEELTLKWAKDK